MKIDQCIEKLAHFFGIELINEISKARVFVRLWKTLTGKTQQKQSRPLFIVNEVCLIFYYPDLV